MPKYNTHFELDVADIEIIEAALRTQMNTASPERQRLIHHLLGKIHHQKTWYRPTDSTYISG